MGRQKGDLRMLESAPSPNCSGLIASLLQEYPLVTVTSLSLTWLTLQACATTPGLHLS
jgi:hypothetical protein